MKILSLTLANTLLAGTVAQTSFAAPSFSGYAGASTTQFQQVSTPTQYQQYQPTGAGFGGQFGGSVGQPQLLGVSYSPYNKPGQSGSWRGAGPSGASGASGASNWEASGASAWSPATAPTSAPAQATSSSVAAKGPRPPNPALSGRSPSEQLQITKCRSAQSCEKCRQLNCYWDVNSKVTNRCIALGLESTQIPVEAGQASNLGYCPTQGQQGFVGVNWLAIENSGASVPNLEGMSDVDVQKWLSTVPGYNPDSTDSNYPAGTAFRELLPTAGSAYAAGKIPSTTPWVSFFDSNLNGGAYNYDGYYDSGYSYDVGQFNAGGLPSGQFSGSFTGSFSGSTGWNDMSTGGFYDASNFNSGLPTLPASSGFSSIGSIGSPSFGGSFGGFTSTGFPSTTTGFPASTGFPSATGFPSVSGFPTTTTTTGFGSTVGFGSTIGPYSSLPVSGMPLSSGFNSIPSMSSFSSTSSLGLQG